MNIPNVNHTVINYVHAYKQAPWRHPAPVDRHLPAGRTRPCHGGGLISRRHRAGGHLWPDDTGYDQRDNRQPASQCRPADQTGGVDFQQRHGATRDRLWVMYRWIPPSCNIWLFRAMRHRSLQYFPGVGTLRPSAPSIPPEYTESLIDWLNQRLRYLSNRQHNRSFAMREQYSWRSLLLAGRIRLYRGPDHHADHSHSEQP